ncbi:MAG: DUF348 domain-containing protein [Bacillales bacterium]|nr:DUF348 domain-containing protein [Bacillales bacterium]
MTVNEFKHDSPMFKSRKSFLLAAGVILLSSTSAYAYYEGTEKTVEVKINNREKKIETRADTVAEVMKELKLPVKPKDYLFPSKEAKVKDGMDIEWRPSKKIHITVEGKKKAVWTTADTVKELLKEEHLSISKFDKVDPSVNQILQNHMDVKINKAFPVTLVDGNRKKTVWTASTTVGDFLKQQGITFGKWDKVEPEFNDHLKANSSVKIVRVKKVTDVVEKSKAFAITIQKDPSLMEGERKVLQEGRNGTVISTYESVYENGRLVSKKLLEERTIVEGRNKIIAEGMKKRNGQFSAETASATSSRGRELLVTATAYTANCSGCSGITATGIKIHSNSNMRIIAVDPGLIPLGSRVYVEGYGYAVAADTGGAIKGNRIDILMPSQSAAAQWGRKQVKVQIID